MLLRKPVFVKTLNEAIELYPDEMDMERIIRHIDRAFFGILSGTRMQPNFKLPAGYFTVILKESLLREKLMSRELKVKVTGI